MDQQQQPTPVKAEKRQQAGLDIYVAACPNCRQLRAAAGPGDVACPCGRHLKFEPQAEEPAK